ncbi:hypothetical protein CEP54_015496 [Fusarium duplospermum]|uniref:Uncharacterized protein n=1 Tax=Fusarium duplospermum TaxID=1325734 RepID=A0A428NNM0_9HYPO|nr:hypothetical protein CEP54_015496 [Fusarium duplospermum]
MLLPFASKSCLEILHLRFSYFDSRVWECINRSWGASATAATNIEETDSIGVLYGTQDWGSQLRKERVSGDVSSPSTYRLQKEFCDLIEWAFGCEGIRSLRTIAVGDFSAAGPCEGRLCISVDSHGILSVLKGRDKRMAYPLEKFQEFVRSETVSLNCDIL